MFNTSAKDPWEGAPISPWEGEAPVTPSEYEPAPVSTYAFPPPAPRTPPQPPAPRTSNITIAPSTTNQVHVNVHGGQPGRVLGDKSVAVAYALWLILGMFGGHKFYLGRPGMGMLYLLTAGLFLIGWIVDAFTLPGQVRRNNIRGY